MQLLESEMNENGKSLLIIEANAEKLPFPDEGLDADTACLSLQITPNHMQMLKEGYRVLRPAHRAAFAVWGRENQCSIVTFFPSVGEKFGIFEKPAKYGNFHLNNIDKLAEDARSIGFSKVKGFYMPSKTSDHFCYS